jgi:hypothetical protein
MVSALLPQVSVAIFRTKMATYVRLSLALPKNTFLRGIEFTKFGVDSVNMGVILLTPRAGEPIDQMTQTSYQSWSG